MGHQMHERVGGIIDMQKFTPWGTSAPDHQFSIAAQFCFMRLAH